MSFHSFLDCRVSAEKSADGLMGLLLQGAVVCSLVAFKILCHMTFNIFNIMYLGEGLFVLT